MENKFNSQQEALINNLFVHYPSLITIKFKVDARMANVKNEVVQSAHDLTVIEEQLWLERIFTSYFGIFDKYKIYYSSIYGNIAVFNPTLSKQASPQFMISFSAMIEKIPDLYYVDQTIMKKTNHEIISIVMPYLYLNKYMEETLTEDEYWINNFNNREFGRTYNLLFTGIFEPKALFIMDDPELILHNLKK